MKRSLLIIILLSVSIFSSFGQHKFQNGYFIYNSDERVDCQILNKNWTYVPAEFQYKLPQSDDVYIALIENVKEFGIDSVSKFVRAVVDIDQSGSRLDNMSYVKDPEFVKKKVFLQVLIEGKASLYLYRDGENTRYFYRVHDSSISQLIFKRYKIGSNIAKNNTFRQQLYATLNCPMMNTQELEDMEYEQRELERYFEDYNECQNSDYITYGRYKKKSEFNLTVRPGIVSRNIYILAKDLPTLNYRLGLQSEILSSTGKWAFVIEPTLVYGKIETTLEGDEIFEGIKSGKMKYYNLELPLGMRRYIYINEKSTIFINALLSYTTTLNVTYEYTQEKNGTTKTYSDSFRGGSELKLMLGAGYRHGNKYSVELQYPSLRSLYLRGDYRTVSLIFGYKL